MEHCVNLNIHWDAPREVWQKISEVYKTMPYWVKNNNAPLWVGENIHLCASVEPSGLQISGKMPDDIWEEWYSDLKKKLTVALGYEIGEPEEGYEFIYYKRKQNSFKKFLLKRKNKNGQ